MKITADSLRHLFAAITLALSVFVQPVTAAESTPALSPELMQLATQVEELSPEQAVELFKHLPAPTMEEMNGEFSGEMTTFPTLWKSVFWTVASNNPFYPGIWQGKSFHQTGPDSGRGYNTVWRLAGGKTDLWPMQTSIGPSYFDGQPSFRLVYRAYDHYAGDIHMLDEIRRLPDGRYLGIGRTGDTAEERRMPMPVLLKARIGDYREDIGTPRPGFNQSKEFELLEFPASAYPAGDQ